MQSFKLSLEILNEKAAIMVYQLKLAFNVHYYQAEVMSADNKSRDNSVQCWPLLKINLNKQHQEQELETVRFDNRPFSAFFQPCAFLFVLFEVIPEEDYFTLV